MVLPIIAMFSIEATSGCAGPRSEGSIAPITLLDIFGMSKFLTLRSCQSTED